MRSLLVIAISLCSGCGAASFAPADADAGPTVAGRAAPNSGAGTGGSIPSEPPIDSSWIAVTSACGFSFHAPPDLVEMKVQGTDSCVVDYEASGCSFTGDYGFYSGSFDELTDLPGYQQMNVVIDGQNALLASYGPIDAPPRPYVAGVHFPILPAGASVKLTFMANCDSAASQATALHVFRTLTFGH